MNDELKGKILKNEKDEDYLVINSLVYKNILCAYAMKTDDNENKQFFQVSNEKLISIQSDKMIKELTVAFFEDSTSDDMPRKIKENETIVDYMNYLDEYYKTKVVSSV